MIARLPSPSPALGFLVAWLLSAGGTSTHLEAATPGASRDSAPVLLSRTGGGGELWSSLKELQAAAAKGNPRAEAALGEILLRGDGLPRDDVRAVTLLEKAARTGHSGAAFRLGMLLTHGENGVARDPARAMAYFKAAAAGGEAEAFFNIGVSHANGRGVKRNYAEALGWLIVARQRGADPGQDKGAAGAYQELSAVDHDGRATGEGDREGIHRSQGDRVSAAGRAAGSGVRPVEASAAGEEASVRDHCTGVGLPRSERCLCDRPASSEAGPVRTA